MTINIRTDCSCKTSAAALKTGHARNGDADHSTASTGYAPAAMSNQSFRPVPEQAGDGVAGDGVAEPFVASAEVKVAVLEAFVRAYMLSRTKTFRDISGLMPEGTQSSLIFITS